MKPTRTILTIGANTPTNAYTPITIPPAIAALKAAYLAEPLQRESETAQPLAEALTDFFAQLLPGTGRSSLFTLTKFCLMELALIKLTRAESEKEN